MPRQVQIPRLAPLARDDDVFAAPQPRSPAAPQPRSPRYLSATPITERESAHETTHVRSHRLAGQRDRLRHVGHGRAGPARTTPSRSQALERAVELGCNFFDTAWAYGDGRSERLLGELVRATPGPPLYAATKIPPKNRTWPSRRGSPLDECLPARPHPRVRREEPGEPRAGRASTCCSSTSGRTPGRDDERWQRAMDDLKREGLVRAASASASIAGSRERARDAAHRPRSTPCR